MTNEDEKKWAWELYIYDIEEFKDQLTQYLEGFTTSDARGIVVGCGEHNALDAWRQMAERGFSLRPNHVHELMKKAVFPKEAVQIKDLEMAIATWEKDVWTFEAASSEKIPASQRRLNLLEMCPEQLKKHLKLLGPEKLTTYEAMKAEIADWVADEMRSRPSRPRAAALEQSRPGVDNIEIDPEWDETYSAMETNQLLNAFMEMPSDNLNHPQLNALVKNLKVKKGKGKGKGKPRVCFECDSPDHIASACPVRIARVAAGGPERLPRNPDVEMTPVGGKGRGAKGEGKGGKGGKAGVWTTAGDHGGYWVPTRAQIKGSGGFPFPTQHQYTHPQQLKSLVADGGWMAAPGAMLSGSLKRLSTRAGVATRNSFSALQTDSELPEGSTLPELPPRRSPDSAPSGDSPPGLSSPREPSWRPVGRTPATKPGERRQGMEQLCGKFQRRAGCVRECCEQKHGATGLTGPLVGQRQDSSNNTRWLARLQIGDFLSKPQTLTSQPLNPAHARDASEPLQHKQLSRVAVAQPHQLRVLTEKRPQSLMPLCSSEEWEYVEFILDSGATATVIPPSVGKAYAIQPGDASRAGVTYEVANGEEIPNLGVKLMPVVTAEGTWRGLRAQVADVSKALQSVRTLVQAGHMVVFGGGDDGDGSYIVNKITGEVTSVKDDGVNYLLGLYIAPAHESGFARPEA